MATKRRYTFSEKRVSKGGRTAFHLAVISLICFLAVILISLIFKGNAGPFVGAISLSAAMLSVYGFYTGMKSFAETDVSPAFSIIGSISSGVVMVAWLTLLLLGFR